MSKAELIEKLAAVEHERWSDWQRWMQSRDCSTRQHEDHPSIPLMPGDLVIQAPRVEHWDRLIATDYADLPEHSKQSDRDQVARYWPLFVDFVAEWIGQSTDAQFVKNTSLKARWLDEMQGIG